MRWVLYVLGFLLSLWPRWLCRGVSRLLGAVWLTVFRYRRRTVLENLAQAFPELPARERRRFARRALDHLVLVMIEFLRMPHDSRRVGFDRLCRVEGLEHFHAAKARQKGVLVLTGHMGSWEMGLCAAAQKTAPASVVVKKLPAWLDGYANDLRRAAGVGVIDAIGGLKDILRTLKRNETVVFVLDQNATRKLGVFVDFFGRSASTMAGLAVIAARTGAPVIGAVAHRDTEGRHVVELHPEIPFEAKPTTEETVRHMTQEYTWFIEAAIRAHPEQWFWTHRRFKTRPLEEKARLLGP